MVNPTYLTAKSTLFMLASADNEDAKRIIGLLGTQDELTQNSKKNNQGRLPISETDMKALLAGSSSAVEARYEGLSRYLRAEDYSNLLDIACGYTPRSLYCAKTGIDYVGVDVPVVAEELQQMYDKLGIEKSHPTYFGGDATNAASLKAAADMLKGRLLISCEGLMQYLSTDEFEQFLGGVRNILLEHDGAWVTSDMGVNYEAFAVACMSSPDAVNLYQTARKQTMSSSDIYNEGIALWDAEKKQAFLRSHGFIVEQVPFYHDDEDLVTLHSLPEAWQNAIRKELESSRLWVMTADKDFEGTPVIDGAKQVENLSIEYSKREGTLSCRVSGRIDTISAPALLEVFDTNSENITRVKLDAENLQYISSAGLRVLMMAAKKLGKDSVTVANSSEAVREIFETTGFDQFIHVE